MKASFCLKGVHKITHDIFCVWKIPMTHKNIENNENSQTITKLEVYSVYTVYSINSRKKCVQNLLSKYEVKKLTETH